MKYLVALDASGPAAGVCVLRDGAILWEEYPTDGPTHSQTLLPLLQRALGEAGITPATVDTYAVTIGPGSFTGLRIALALVKGLALPYGTPCVGVSTLAATACGWPGEGLVLPSLDARRGEVYWSLFNKQAHTFQRLVPDAAGPAASLAEHIQQPEPVFLVGDGAELCYNISGQTAGHFLKDARPALPARGAAVIAARTAGSDAVSAAALRPVYLRLSQAERERLHRLGTADSSSLPK